MTVRHLSHRVRGKVILDDVSFELSRGTTVVLGPNGAGKSTLFRILATAQSCPKGAVELLGLDIGRDKDRRALRPRLGYVPQSLDFYAGFTVSDLVTYIGLMKGIKRTNITARVNAAIDSVGLTESKRTRLGALSGGMLRRASIAQAIVNDPVVLLLDEPTAGLDPAQLRAFRATIERVGGNRTVILSTHLVDDVARLAHQVLVLERGRVMFHDTPAALARLDATAAEGDRIEAGFEAVLRNAPTAR